MKRLHPGAWRRAAVLASVLAGAGFVSAQAANIHLPDGPGVDLVYAKCQTCHDLQYLVDSKGLLDAQWSSVLASMGDFGLQLSASEHDEILRYLTTYLGAKPPPANASVASGTPGAADGREVFERNCSSCHGANGQGQPGYYPPLAGNADLRRGARFPVLVVLYGLAGPIDVGGSQYDGSMPPFGHLSDAEIASVVGFVRNGLGKPAAAAQSGPALTAADVAGQRQRSMTPAQVHDYRAALPK